MCVCVCVCARALMDVCLYRNKDEMHIRKK